MTVAPNWPQSVTSQFIKNLNNKIFKCHDNFYRWFYTIETYNEIDIRNWKKWQNSCPGPYFCDHDNEVENICVVLLYLAKQIVFKAIFQDAYTKLLFVFPANAVYSLLLCSFLKLWKKICSFASPIPPPSSLLPTENNTVAKFSTLKYACTSSNGRETE